MDPTFFETPADFRAWLAENHAKAGFLWVGFYKKGSGRRSITWPESVDEALCYGWIDGVRKGIDARKAETRPSRGSVHEGPPDTQRFPDQHNLCPPGRIPPVAASSRVLEIGGCHEKEPHLSPMFRPHGTARRGRGRVRDRWHNLQLRVGLHCVGTALKKCGGWRVLEKCGTSTGPLGQ